MTGAACRCADRADEGVQSPHLGVAEPGALLGVAVDLDDRVVHVGQCVLIDARQQRRLPGQPDQGAGRDRVQLPDMAEAELRRNDPRVDGA